MVIVDGFEDRGYCWGVLEQIDIKEVRLIVTTVDRTLAICALRAIGSSDESCLIEVAGLDRDQWNQCLSEVIGESYPLVFGALHGRFQGCVAGLRLLLAALVRENDPKRTLFGARVRLEDQAEVVDSEIAVPWQRYEYRHRPEDFFARLWWRHNFDAGMVLWILSSVPLVGMSISTLAFLLENESGANKENEIEQSLRALEQDSFVYPLHLGAETLWVPLDYFRTCSRVSI